MEADRSSLRVVGERHGDPPRAECAAVTASAAAGMFVSSGEGIGLDKAGKFVRRAGTETGKVGVRERVLADFSASMAEGVRFELTVPLRARRFSRPVP